MNYKVISLCSLVFSPAVFGQDLPPNQTVFFDQNINIQPKLLLDTTATDKKLIPEMAITASLEEQINHAIVSKDWRVLQQLLQQYQKTKNYDHILYDYGIGALYRYQGQQKKAIQVYREIIKNNPHLYYPHFDLAMMLFEDKQYANSQEEFLKVRPFLPIQMQNLIDDLLVKIKKTQAWQPNVSVNFENTDNVNQSSNIKEISIGDTVFVRDQESLPQKAHGIGYNLNASREYNVVNNHYLYLNVGLDGTIYWDNQDYSEQTLRFDLGYRYKDIKQSFGITPLFAQNILGDSRYSKNYGIGLDYNRILSDRWQLSANTSYIEKKYQDDQVAKFYDGHSNSQSAMLIHQLRPKLIVYSGVDLMQDHLLDDAESSDRKGGRIGAMYFGDILGFSTSLRYAKRDFLANNFLYGRQRQDNEFNFSMAVWHKKWQWHNFTPKLNYQYQKIDSNLPLYERNNSTWFITVDKIF